MFGSEPVYLAVHVVRSPLRFHGSGRPGPASVRSFVVTNEVLCDSGEHRKFESACRQFIPSQ
jgi:hypothetical protein